MPEEPPIKSAGIRLRFASDIGHVIRNEREDRGLTQSELASLAGVSRKWLSSVENGKESSEIGKVLAVLRRLRIDLQAAAAPEPAVDPDSLFASLRAEVPRSGRE